MSKRLSWLCSVGLPDTWLLSSEILMTMRVTWCMTVEVWVLETLNPEMAVDTASISSKQIARREADVHACRRYSC